MNTRTAKAGQQLVNCARGYEALVAQLREEQAKGLGSESDYVFTSLMDDRLDATVSPSAVCSERRKERAPGMSPHRRFAVQ